MKKLKLWLMLTALPLFLIGCNQAKNSESSGDLSATEPATEAVTEPATESEPLTVSGAMPVLNITSIENPDNTDFASEPVARHVAESIASWTPNYKIPPEPYYELCSVTLTDADENLLLDSALADVKVRGNWTTTYDKKPLRLRFTERQNLLGMNDGAEMKNWLLLAEYKDASMLRDKTAFAIAEEILSVDDLYVSDAELVEVVINGEYWGVYLLAEYQQINENRVAITEAQKDYTGTDIGYFLEFDGYFAEEEKLKSFKPSYADNAPLIPFNGDEISDETITPQNEGRWDYKQDTGITIKSDIYSQEQHDFIESYVNNVYRIMYSAAYDDKAYVLSEDCTTLTETTELTPRQAVEAVVNVESLADAYIINELFCDADIYWSSFFMDVDFGEGGDRRLRFEAPWDFDSALGNKDRCSDGQGFYAANIVYDVNDQYETINPWLAVLMHEEWFQEIIREKWTAAYDGGVFDRAYTMIDEDTENFASAFTQNEKRWNSLLGNSAKNEWAPSVKRCHTHQEMAEQLKKWLSSRVDFMNSYWYQQ